MRDKAIFETLYGTGIRVSELVELDLQDVDLQIDYLYCNKGKNQRVIPLCEVTKLYLQKYIEEGRDNLVKEDESALFVNAQGQRFTSQGLWKVIKKYATMANISKNINPSILRHSFALHLLKGGANVAVVSRILGNSNLSSLQLYLNQMDNNIRKEIKDKHPRKRDDILKEETCMSRVIWIVIDSVGVGALKDSEKFGDIGVNTLGNIVKNHKDINIPNMIKLGLGNIDGIDYLPKDRKSNRYHLVNVMNYLVEKIQLQDTGK